MAFYSWSTTAATNASADSSINYAEGQPPASLNDSGRALMAVLAKWGKDISGALTTGGSSTAYTLTTNSVFDSLAHMDKAMIAFIPHVTNGSNATINIDGLGAVPIRSAPGQSVSAGILTSGTPAVGTYVNATTEFIIQGGFASGLSEVVDIRSFGGVGDGTTANDSAWTSAVAALPSSGGVLFFPPGKFKFTSQTAVGSALATTGSITIMGAGADATILYWPNASGGIAVSLAHPSQSFNARDLSITTGTTAGGTGLSITQAVPEGAWAKSYIRDVTFRGDDNNASFYWNTCLSTTALSGLNISDCLFYGDSAGTHSTGAVIQGSGTSPNYAIQINFNGCFFNSCNIGIQYGSYTQGVTVEQCNFTNGTFGIVTLGGELGTLAQLAVTDSQFNTTSDQVVFNTAIIEASFTGNLFFIPSGHTGLLLNSGQQAVIAANNFQALSANNGNGIIGNAPMCAITGNVFNQLAAGVTQQSSGTLYTIAGNVFQAVVTGVTLAGQETMVSGNVFNGSTTGINVTHASASAFVNIQSNFYANNVTNTLPASTTGTIIVGGGSA